MNLFVIIFTCFYNIKLFYSRLIIKKHKDITGEHRSCKLCFLLFMRRVGRSISSKNQWSFPRQKDDYVILL